MTPDSSAVVAAFASWHEQHDRARRALRGRETLVAHVELEAYSVLTRLPVPFRAGPALVVTYLAARHPGDRLALPHAVRRGLVPRLAELGISGGAVYDALVGITAAHHGLRLLSCDRRAAATYERIGAAFEFLA